MRTRRNILTLGVGSFASGALMPSPAFAKDRRVQREKFVIDARRDYRDAVKTYQKKVFDLESRRVRALYVYVRVLVDGRKGFDAGWLRLPRQLMYVSLHITLHVTRGSVRRNIRTNLIELRRGSRVRSINQHTIIR